jgi:YbbR domain-containing protein
MGGPPMPGEDQNVTVTVTGPDKGDNSSEYNSDFKKFVDEMQALRKKYTRLKVTVRKITYEKKDRNDSFEYREWKP